MNQTINSTLDVHEEERSAERTRADLKKPDPKPETAKAVLQGQNKSEDKK